MKTTPRLNAIFIAVFLFIGTVYQSNAQRAIRNRSNFPANPVIVKQVSPSVHKNLLKYSYSRRPVIMNRFSYQTRFRPYGRRTRLPFGFTLSILPRGYWSFNFGGFPYFYYSGVFYRSTHDHQYQVVEAPIGAEVPDLPNDAKPIIINDQKLYEYLGVYYKEVLDVNGKKHYIVQGKDGILNTDNFNEVKVENNKPTIGDIVLQLPNQTKVVVINGKKLYTTPENIYYEEFLDANILKYKVVGM